MPGYTSKDSSHQDSSSSHESTAPFMQVSRQAVITMGVHALHEIGSNSICNVCIANGGSCCQGCRHLVKGIGCQICDSSCRKYRE